MSCPVDETFDPLSPDYLADPYAILAALPHREQPVFYAPAIGYYVLTRYDDIAAVFRDPASYSAAVAQAPLGPITERAQKILLGACWTPSRARRSSIWSGRWPFRCRPTSSSP
jgi:cytochrome P450